MSIRKWIKVLRPRFSHFVGIVCGMAFAGGFSVLYFGLSFLFIYAFLFYGILANFVYDFDSDKINPSMKNYPHLRGKIKINKIEIASYLWLTLAIASGLALFYVKNNIIFLLVTLFAFHCAYSYSVPPLRLKRFWWGGAVTYTFSTMVAFLVAALALGSAFSITFLLILLMFWIGSLSGWWLTHISDRNFDRKTNITTPPLKFGVSKCIFFHRLLVAISSLLAVLIVTLEGFWWISFIFVLPMLISFPGKGILYGNDWKRIRKHAHTIGTAPYWINILLITIFFILML